MSGPKGPPIADGGGDRGKRFRWAGIMVGWLERETLIECLRTIARGVEPVAQQITGRPCHPKVIRSLRRKGLLQTESKIATRSGVGAGNYTRLVVGAVVDADGVMRKAGDRDV